MLLVLLCCLLVSAHQCCVLCVLSVVFELRYKIHLVREVIGDPGELLGGDLCHLNNRNQPAAAPRC